MERERGGVVRLVWGGEGGKLNEYPKTCLRHWSEECLAREEASLCK